MEQDKYSLEPPPDYILERYNHDNNIKYYDLKELLVVFIIGAELISLL